MIQPYNTNAMDEFRVKRCHRGFIICAGGPEYGGLINPMFAFDRIEDAAEFIVNHFAAQNMSGPSHE